MPEHNMEKIFNTTGPSIPETHYMIDPLRRIYDEISELIDRQSYFALCSPRQSGKTTSLFAIMDKINSEGKYYCSYINVEAARPVCDDVDGGITVVLSCLANAVEELSKKNPSWKPVTIFSHGCSGTDLLSNLETLCKSLDKPLVLLIDDVDALFGDALISMLHQLRVGHDSRPHDFPISVLLCGMQDVRECRIYDEDGQFIYGGSLFNIKAASLLLEDFSQDDIRQLYLQHTEETGQMFGEDVYPKVWELTHGQPWLVNAIADQVTSKMPEGQNRNNTITLAMVEEAANRLIIERMNTPHLSQLVSDLSERRVQDVISPFLTGEHWNTLPTAADLQYAIDIGLLRREGIAGGLVIANDIYREIIMREVMS